MSRTSIHIICCYYIRIVRQVTGLLLSNFCENIVMKSIWKFIAIFPNQVLSFLNTPWILHTTVSVHTINIPCLITANDICQIKQVFTEFCLKHTWGSIVWMQPTSVCVFGGCTRLRRAFVKNDATDFVICDRK